MNIESIIKLVADINSSGLSHVEITNSTKKLVEDFYKGYKIVPKEQWCVGITTSGSYSHEVGIQGPFNTEIEAKIFASIWNRKRDEFIEKTLEENPNNEDLEFPYLKANAYKLEISDKNDLILKEMIQIIEDGIDKIQREGIK